MNRIYIFDVDGTLYSQKKMHCMMLGRLAGYYMMHPFHVKDLYFIYKFRKYREKNEYKDYSIKQLAQVVHKDSYEVIQKWLFEVPLQVIQKCAYNELIFFITNLPDGEKVVIYSDYPATEKLKALGISADMVVTAEDESVSELKPSKKAMEYILASMGGAPSDYIYVGDRDCKDGESARSVGVKYVDVKDFIKSL